MKGKFEGYTGKIAESETLGETQESDYEKEGYVTYQQALDLAKDSQPFKDSTDPYEKRFPQDVHATVAKLLALEDFSQLKYYTAVNSPLDRFHGIDAFFELDIGEGEYIIATMDMTQNPNKQDYKADVVFQWPTEGLDYNDSDDKPIWQDKVNEVAQQVLEVLKQKTGQLRSLTKKELSASEELSERQRKWRLSRLSKRTRKEHVYAR